MVNSWHLCPGYRRVVLITSRSYAEYQAMFDLAAEDMAGGALDVCAGGSSFVAECGQRGVSAWAVDPMYAWSQARLAEVVRSSVGEGHRIIAEHPDRFVWTYYGSLDRHRQIRGAAADRFLADRSARPGHYLAGELPRLSFRDGSAPLVLCSHLLFTWSEQLGAAWHLAALRELVRVAAVQVRVFPLVLAGTGSRVPFLDDLLDEMRSDGVTVTVRKVPYEFQAGADEMLVLS